jgi:hypothetical protein
MVEIDLQNPRHVGVDGESDLSVWGRGNQAVGSLAAAIVSLTDQDGTDGIPIRVNDDLIFFDNPDSRLPTTRIDLDGRTIRQRDHVIQTLRTALESMEGMSGDTNARARAIADFLPRLENALYSNPNTTLDLTAIITILRQRGLSLSEIAAASGTSGEGDAVVRSLLREINLDPIQFETRDGMANALDELERADTIEDIEGNLAWQRLQNIPTDSLTTYNQSILEEARVRLTRARAEQAAAESEATAEPEVTVADLRREIGRASLENLQTIIRDSDRRELLRGDRDLRIALTQRVQDLIVEDSTVSAQAVRDLSPYLALEQGEAIISFLQGDQQHVAMIVQSERTWAFEGDHFNDLRIEIDDGSLVVREDRIFGHRFRTAVIATRDSVAGRSTEQTLFNLGVSMERIEAGMADREVSRGEVSQVGDSRGINAALFRRIDRDGDDRLSSEELGQFHEMVTRYANDHGISVDRAYELYRTSTSFVLDNFAARGVARDRIILELTEGNDDSHGVNFTQLATMDSDEARIALASDLEGLGYDPQIIAAALDQHEGSYQNITAETLASYLIRISSAAMHGTEFFNVETSIPEFPSGLVTTRGILCYLHGEDYDEPLSLGSASDVRAAARRLERDPRYRELFYNVTHYRNIGNWVRLAADLAGTLMNSESAEDHQIAELLPQILEIYGGPEYAASVLEREPSYNSTMANRYTRLGNYDRAYHYAQRITDSQETERTLRSLVGALMMSGPTRTMGRGERLDLAYQILQSDAYTFDDRQERLLGLVRMFHLREDIREGSGPESTREARRDAIEILNFMMNPEGMGLGPDHEIEVPSDGQRRSMTLTDYINQLRDEQRMPLAVVLVRRRCLSRGGRPRIAEIPEGMRQLNVIVQTATREINDLDTSEQDRREHRITRAYALRTMADMARAMGDFQWNHIRYELSQRGSRPHFQNSDCYRTYITMARLAREATLEFEALAEGDEAERFGQEARACNSIIADVVYDAAELYAGRNDGNPQGLHAHEAYRNHFRRAFQDIARYMVPERMVDTTTTDGRQQQTWTWTVGRRVGLPTGPGWPLDAEHGMPNQADLQPISQLTRASVLGVLDQNTTDLNGLAGLSGQRLRTRTELLTNIQELRDQINGVTIETLPNAEQVRQQLADIQGRIDTLRQASDRAQAAAAFNALRGDALRQALLRRAQGLQRQLENAGITSGNTRRTVTTLISTLSEGNAIGDGEDSTDLRQQVTTAAAAVRTAMRNSRTRTPVTGPTAPPPPTADTGGTPAPRPEQQQQTPTSPPADEQPSGQPRRRVTVRRTNEIFGPSPTGVSD